MAVITPPSYVRQVLTTLQARGHLAFLVGGCVRDMLMGVHPYDWDVCTSALPEQVSEIFPHTLPVGIRHGTVTVLVRSRKVEVTTFRSDSEYSDHRHPDAVSFVGDLTTDLSRRDFTMNAIALSADGLMIDPFGGRQDIEDKLIRSVGDPDRRFSEDALRMFRALRFSARLGFRIEPETEAAIARQAPLAEGLSAERVRDEVEKLLLTKRPERMDSLIEAGLLDSFLLRRLPEYATLFRLNAVPRKALFRWAMLCELLEEQGCIRAAEDFLLRLRLDSRTIRCCSDCAAILQQPVPGRPVEWKRQLNRYGVETVTCAARCRDALQGGGSYREVRAVLNSGECFSMKHLAVTGDDLLALGLKGRALGDMLQFLLDYVMEFPENNRRDLLLSLARDSEE